MATVRRYTVNVPTETLFVVSGGQNTKRPVNNLNVISDGIRDKFMEYVYAADNAKTRGQEIVTALNILKTNQSLDAGAISSIDAIISDMAYIDDCIDTESATSYCDSMKVTDMILEELSKE